MPRDGSGNYTRSDGTRTGTTVWDKNKTAGIKITSAAHDLHDQDMADAINDSVAKDGQTVMTGDLDMGGNKVTNTTPTTGSFTPSYRVLGGGSFTYTIQQGYYQLIEDIVFFNLVIAATKVSSPLLYVEIEGLPFVSSSTPSASNAYTCTMGNYSGLTISDRLSGEIQIGTQRIFVNDGTSFLTYANTTTPRLAISGFYQKA
jgi:hypothetical protein